MNAKSPFLDEDLEEVYIKQPNVFQLSNDPKIVCRLKKDLYGLKQAPNILYGRLDKCLMY